LRTRAGNAQAAAEADTHNAQAKEDIPSLTMTAMTKAELDRRGAEAVEAVEVAAALAGEAQKEGGLLAPKARVVSGAPLLNPRQRAALDATTMSTDVTGGT
jgi:hypothetical protein